ncbi:MAG: RtcB family protein [Kiritimatiellia bacterium]
MQWRDADDSYRVPILSWCRRVDEKAMSQARDLARHPHVFHHIALMPDCHPGYGMPIGGVIACPEHVIPNAVGVDIGCGMGAIQTDCEAAKVTKETVRKIMESIKRMVPLGEGRGHRSPQSWDKLDDFEPSGNWMDNRARELAYRNLGTLGGGNHFIELQAGDDGFLWMMLHSGSRNLGYRIAEWHHGIARSFAADRKIELPAMDLASLPVDSRQGQDYIRDMNFALAYARENRARMMQCFRVAVQEHLSANFTREINIHHNYAVQEEHFGRKVWVHRKGATSAREGEWGIIPGSMGTSSCIVRGRGNADSFQSCSHGAGRCLGRNEACRKLDKDACDRAMRGIVFDGWNRMTGRGRKAGEFDLGEAPAAYKDINEVMESQSDLVEIAVRLRPLGVLKG